ncbi:MAG: hypothetical protein B6D46_07015 [Polyangiaceae bacterium UTPRO1]|nr:MAG: hypothetical protein B6D46_07015 [Polyangiaceae bacterium UTPRO1]
MYGGNGTLVKTIPATDIHAISVIPLPLRIEAYTVASKSRTVLRLDGVALDRDLGDEMCTKGALARGVR